MSMILFPHLQVQVQWCNDFLYWDQQVPTVLSAVEKYFFRANETRIGMANSPELAYYGTKTIWKFTWKQVTKPFQTNNVGINGKHNIAETIASLLKSKRLLMTQATFCHSITDQKHWTNSILRRKVAGISPFIWNTYEFAAHTIEPHGPGACPKLQNTVTFLDWTIYPRMF